MKNLLVFIGLMVSVFTTKAQYDYSYDNSYDNGSNVERYFYDEEFDWRWDVRVRISDGIRSGRITNFEANNLYRRLERIERLEYAYQADGFFDDYEQNEIWNEVKWLNRQVGIDLRDFDRRYYGYAYVGGFRGYIPFYFGRTYNFNRFDQRGYGNVRIGYRSRYFVPSNHYYGRNNRTYGYNRNDNNRINNNRNNNNRYDNNRNNIPRREDRNTKSSEWNNRNNVPRGEDRNSKSNEWNNRNDNSRNSRSVESPNNTSRNGGNSTQSRGNSRGSSSNVERGSSNGRQATPQKAESSQRGSSSESRKTQSGSSRGSN